MPVVAGTTLASGVRFCFAHVYAAMRFGRASSLHCSFMLTLCMISVDACVLSLDLAAASDCCRDTCLQFEPSVNVYGVLMCLLASAARALKSVLQELLLTDG